MEYEEFEDELRKIFEWQPSKDNKNQERPFSEASFEILKELGAFRRLYEKESLENYHYSIDRIRGYAVALEEGLNSGLKVAVDLAKKL